MTEPAFLFNGAADAPRTIALAHGAGAPMDSPFMDAFAEGLAERAFRVARFEFPYMAERRAGGPRRPPNPAPRLMAAWRAVIETLGPQNLIIGGKSMGGRIASMLADEMGVRGLVCLGYPFHPPGKPDKTRIAHLAGLRTPALFVQGTRDSLGGRDEVSSYPLSPAIRFAWMEDGDHGFKPRKASGFSERGHWRSAIEAVADFAGGL